jgi:hypothetical protein
MLRRKDITPHELDSTKIKLDSRRLIDRLRFLVRFSKEVNFFDASNQKNGDWSPFLLKDPLIFNAWLSEAKYREPCQEFLGVAYRLEQNMEIRGADISWNDEVQLMMMRQLGRNLALLYEELHSWFSTISMHHHQEKFGNEILTALQRDIAPQLRVFVSIQRFLGDLPPQANTFSELDLSMVEQCWANAGLHKSFTDSESSDLSSCDFSSPQLCLQTLRYMHKAVFGFYLRSTEQAVKDYHRLLSGFSGKPDTSLLIALASRLDDYSDQLNRFVGQQLNFYYEKILRGSPEGEIADEVYLCLKLIDGNEIIDLPKATLFKAGLYANKKPILFETIKNETVNSASIKSILTLHPDSKEQGEFGLLKREISSCIGEETKNSLATGSREFGQDLFNSHQGERIASEVMIASPLLCLSSGQRIILVTFKLTTNINAQHFSDSNIFMSTVTGWYQTKETNWTQKDDTTVQLVITLDTQFPRVQRCIKEQTVPDSRWPLLRITFGPKLDLTKGMTLETIQLEVDVQNAQAVFSSDGGILKSATLAYPFGPVPHSGNNLNIHLPELYIKPITSLSLSLSWNKLPSDFYNYYSAYNDCIEVEGDKFNNTCFHIEGQQLSKDQWQPLGFIPQTLFSQDEAGNNEPCSDFSLSVQGLYFLPSIEDEQSLYESQKQALLRLTLGTTPNGFGHELYSSVIASWSLAQSQLPAVTVDTKTVNKISTAPPLPWIPQTKRMVLNYKSLAKTNFCSESNETSLQLFHKSALSQYLVYDSHQAIPYLDAYPPVNSSHLDKSTSGSVASAPKLFPVSNKEGVVYLTFSHAITETPISLLFQMSSLGVTRSLSKEAIRFYYLSAVGWSEFSPLKDETHGLTTSGILTLQLPDGAISDSSLLRDSDYCIAIVNDSKNGNRGRPVLIDTQAIRARRVLPTSLKDEEPIQLPPFAIKGPNTKVQGLKSVSQAFSSFAGREREDQKGFKQRLSQRIRHKNRAVSRYDFECLCLTYLPQAYSARCICDPNNPSNLTLMVIGSHEHGPSVIPPQIGTDNLNYAKDQLAKNSSMFSSIQVVNMLHQPLRISADVRFKNDYGSKRECGQIAESIRRYMSPWYKQSSSSIDPNKGFHRVDILNLISAQQGVTQVTALLIEVGKESNGEWIYQEKSDGVLFPMNSQYVFVADAEIDIKNVANEPQKVEPIS